MSNPLSESTIKKLEKKIKLIVSNKSITPQIELKNQCNIQSDKLSPLEIQDLERNDAISKEIRQIKEVSCYEVEQRKLDLKEEHRNNKGKLQFNRNTIQLEDDDEREKPSKVKQDSKKSLSKQKEQAINSADLAKLLIQKNRTQKAKASSSKTLPKASSPQRIQQTPIKTLQSSGSNLKNSKPNLSNPNTINLPNVSTMNNLLKLSTKLPMNQFLKQVRYRAKLYKIDPIKLLFYFCVEKIIFTIYTNNGFQKVKRKATSIDFILKEIGKALISLLSFLKLNEKAIINRTLQAVFTRFGIRQRFTSDFLLKCIKQNRNLFDKTGADIETILKEPEGKKISSNIFEKVPNVDKPIKYEHLKLNLENQDSSHELIDDPQKYHQNYKLYYYKESKQKQKEKQDIGNVNEQLSNNKISRKANGKSKSKDHSNTINIKNQIHQIDSSSQNQCYQIQEQGNKKKSSKELTYEPRNFVIAIKKLPYPSSMEVSNKKKNSGALKILKPKSSQTVTNDHLQNLSAVKRNRPMPPNKVIIQESMQQYLPSQSRQVSRQKILQFIEDYIFCNIEDIAAKISKTWKLQPIEIVNILKQHPQNRPSLFTNYHKNENKMGFKNAQVVVHNSKKEYENDVMKIILNMNQEYKSRGKSDIELAKDVLQMLEERKIPNQSKEKILQKVLEIKKNEKK